jgi:hypothetical protein
MVSIRLWLEVSSPTGEGVQRLPVLPGELVVAGVDEIFSVDVEQINIDGKANEMKTVRDSFAGSHVRLRLTGTAYSLTECALKALVVDVVEEPR